jgi:hypothetical protein
MLWLMVNGRFIGEVVVRRGASCYERRSERGKDVAVVDANDVLQVVYAGQVLLEGRSYPE